MSDLTLAVRRLKHRPGSTLIAVVSLGLAIGFSTAAFSVIDAYYWRSVPVDRPEQLALFAVKDREGRLDQMGWPEVERIQHALAGQGELVTQNRQGPRVRLPGGDDYPITAGVSANFFQVLGVRAAQGRIFGPQDEADGQVVLTDRYWRRHFGGDPAVVGEPLQVGPASLTILGVLPPGFSGTHRGLAVDLYVPPATMFGSLRMTDRQNRRSAEHEALLRLRPGITLEAAKVRLDGVFREMEADGTAIANGRTAQLYPFLNPDPQRGASLGDLFPWIALLVLLIAAANLANLRLVDNEARRRETGIQLALGARGSQLLRQHLAESVLLTSAAAALGLLLAAWLIEVAPAMLYGGRPYTEYFIRFDWRVAGFGGITLGLVAALGALIPVTDAWRQGVLTAINAPRQAAASRWLRGLVVLQMALVTAVGTSSVLLWQSLANVSSVRPAMDPERPLLLAAGNWDTADEAGAARNATVAADELARLPGVVRAAYARRVMLSGSGGGRRVTLEIPGQSKVSFRYTQVSPNYFAATGARVLAGRVFDGRDSATGTPVAMVSAEFARRYGGVGQWVRLQGVDRLVIGVVEDGPSLRLKEAIEPFVYFSFAQVPDREMTFLIETSVEPGLVTDGLREGLKTTRFDVVSFTTLASYLRGQRREEELAAMVAGALAGLGLLLAAAGLFGVSLYSVTRRLREMGVRLAVGATPGSLRREVLSGALRLVLWALPAGWVLALAFRHLLSGLLYGVTASSLAVLGGVSVGVLGVALLAAVIPARRAARTDPIRALRYE